MSSDLPDHSPESVPQPSGHVLPYANPVSQHDPIVVLATFPSTFEAHLAVGKLENAGIRSFLEGENFNSAGGAIYGAAVAGVTVRIAQSDVERARAVLPSRSVGPPPCPKCHSGNTEVRSLQGLAGVFSWLLFGLPELFRVPRYHCKACDFVWKFGYDPEHDDPDHREQLIENDDDANEDRDVGEGDRDERDDDAANEPSDEVGQKSDDPAEPSKENASL